MKLRQLLPESSYDQEIRDHLLSGGVLKNDIARYFIVIRKDGQRVFEVNGKYKFFPTVEAFIKAAIKITKTG